MILIQNLSVRFRTCGDITITGATKSNAKNIDDILFELENYKFY